MEDQESVSGSMSPSEWDNPEVRKQIIHQKFEEEYPTSKKISRVCENCLKEFYPPIKHISQRFCCIKCWGSYRTKNKKPKEPKKLKKFNICPQCGTKFTEDRKFCGASCRRDFYEREDPEQKIKFYITCSNPECNKIFETYKPYAKYCSKECWKTHYYVLRTQRSVASRLEKLPIVNVCEYCNRTFRSETPQRFHSKDCQNSSEAFSHGTVYVWKEIPKSEAKQQIKDKKLDLEDLVFDSGKFYVWTAENRGE